MTKVYYTIITLINIIIMGVTSIFMYLEQLKYTAIFLFVFIIYNRILEYIKKHKLNNITIKNRNSNIVRIIIILLIVVGFRIDKKLIFVAYALIAIRQLYFLNQDMKNIKNE